MINPLIIMQNYINKKQFKGANCDIKSLVIGPEYSKNFNLIHNENLTIGIGTVFNGDLFINSLGRVEIGKYCHFAKGLTIYSSNHNWKSERFIPYDSVNIKKAVKIGDAVWFGANVIVAPGANIGNGVIASIGSVLFGTIPDCAIVRGNPATIIAYRDKDVFAKLLYEKKFN